MSPHEIDYLVEAIAQRVIDRLVDSLPTKHSDIYLDSHQAAELLGCSVPTVERLTRAGSLPSVKFGRLRRYRRSEVLAATSAKP